MLQVVLRVLQRRFVLGLLRDRLIEGGLVGPRIDLGQNITLLHHLALFEIDLGDLAVDPAAHRDRVVRLDDAEAVEIDGEIGLSHRRDGDRDRRRRRALSFGSIRGGAIVSTPGEITANRDCGHDRDQPPASEYRPFGHHPRRS